MAEVDLAIYKTPSQAAALGTKITKTATISKEDAVKISDYYKEVEAMRQTTNGLISAVTGACGIGFKACTDALSIISVTAGIGFLGSYFGQMGTAFNTLARDMAAKQSVTFTYTYRQKGSNDGAYWLTGVN